MKLLKSWAIATCIYPEQVQLVLKLNESIVMYMYFDLLPTGLKKAPAKLAWHYRHYNLYKALNTHLSEKLFIHVYSHHIIGQNKSCINRLATQPPFSREVATA